MFNMSEVTHERSDKSEHDAAPTGRYRRLIIAAAELKQIFTPAAIARMAGISDQVIANWKTRGVPDKDLLKMARILECNPFWLENGEGDMEIATPGISKEAIELARAFDNLSAQQRAAYRVLLHQDDERPDGNTAPIGTKTERKRYTQ